MMIKFVLVTEAGLKPKAASFSGLAISTADDFELQPLQHMYLLLDFG